MSGFLGWGRLKLQAITEQFGDEESLAAQLSLPAVPTPVVPETQDARPELDLERVLGPWIRLPAVDYAPALAATPPIAPREWTGCRREGGQSYLELASVDVEEAVAQVERLRDVIARGDS